METSICTLTLLHTFADLTLQNNNLERSGIQTVAGECMCAIAGAVTFSKGTVYARSFIVNRYLQLLMQNKGDGKVL